MSNRTDNFNRADSSSALGTPSDGGSDWVAASGTWGISSNKGYCVSSGGGVVWAYLESSISDIDFQVTLSTVDTNATYVIFRFIDTGNLWFVSNDGSTWDLYVRAGSSNTHETNNYTAAAVNGDVVRIVANGSATGAIQVYINGVLRITSSTNETFHATATKHGLGVNFNTASRFDDFSVTPPGGAAVAAPISLVRKQASNRASRY